MEGGVTSTATTAPRTEPAHTAPRAERDRWAAISPAARGVGLVATLLTIASLEYGAGIAAGWAWWQAAGVPLAIDLFVLGVLLSPKSRQADRLFALALAEATVVASAVWGDHGKDSKVLLGAALATALIAALWRQDETIRRDRAHRDLLAVATARAEAAERRVAELEAEIRAEIERAGQTAADRASVEAEARARVEELRERAEAADLRAVAAETRAAELERQIERDRRDRRDERPPVEPTGRRTTVATTDADRRRIVRLVLAGGTDKATGKTFAADPAASRRSIAQAIRDCGHTAGRTEDLGPLVDAVRAELVSEGHHLAPAPTGTDD